MPHHPPLRAILYREAVSAALLEDLGRAGDLTTDAIVPEGVAMTATLTARENGVVAGLPVAAEAFRAIDPSLDITFLKTDGDRVVEGEHLAVVTGSARSILTAERVALNFLGHLSGVASAAAAIADAIAHTRARVADTRKTTPGLRALQKHAVRLGGGVNHRFGLDDAVLIKDNHVAVAGGIAVAIARVKGQVGHLVKIQVEVDTLDQLRAAMEVGVDAVLLDNMSPALCREAVALVSTLR